VVGRFVGLGVGNEDGIILGDGLGISDGALLGRSVGAAVTGHVTHANVMDVPAFASSRPLGQYSHVDVVKGGVKGHSLVSG